jgi:hypothetical protein
MNTFRRGVVACLVLLAVPAVVRAEDFAVDVPNRIWVDFGGSTNDISTTASLSGEAGVGASIDFEDVFNLPGNKNTFRLFGTWRISEMRRYIDFGFVNINRSGSRIVQDDIVWGDNVFQAGGEVTADFKTQFVYVAFRYDFLHEEKVHIAGSAGASVTSLKVGLSGNGNVTGPGGPISGEFSNEQSVTAPVPMVGFNIDWAIAKRLIFRSYTRFFWIKIDPVNGFMNDSGVHLNWLFVRHFGVGLGYDKNEIRIKEVEVNGDDTGKFDYSVSGFGLYLNLAF